MRAIGKSKRSWKAVGALLFAAAASLAGAPAARADLDEAAQMALAGQITPLEYRRLSLQSALRPYAATRGIGTGLSVAATVATNTALPSAVLGVAVPAGLGAGIREYGESLELARLAVDRSYWKETEAAAMGGDKEALLKLAEAHFGGEFGAPDLRRAAACIMAAAATGDARALNKAGVVFAKGWGVQQDLELAQTYFEKAASLGHAAAALNAKLPPEKIGWSRPVMAEGFSPTNIDRPVGRIGMEGFMIFMGLGTAPNGNTLAYMSVLDYRFAGLRVSSAGAGDPQASYLEDDKGRRYALVAAHGIQLSPRYSILDPGDLLCFVLEFEPLEPDAEWFDLIEPAGPGSWVFRKVPLRPKK